MQHAACDHPVGETLSNAAIKCYFLFFQVSPPYTSMSFDTDKHTSVALTNE